MSVVLHPAVTLTPHTFRLPDAIRELGTRPHWLVWRYVGRNYLKKPTKVPRRWDDPEKNASTANPATWTTMEAALDSWARHQNSVNGIGYVLSNDADLVMLDIDDCRDPYTEVLSPFAEDLVRRCQSYAEVTPSRCGIRIIGRAGQGYLPERLARALKIGSAEAPDKIEIYRASRRYVTVTGWQIPGTPHTLAEIGQPIAAILQRSDVRDAYDAASALSNLGALGIPEDLRAALQRIPNADMPWEDWNKIGMAIFAAFGGAEEGFEWFRYWSSKSIKHTDEECYERWDNYHRSPPDRLSAGTLIHMARQADPTFKLPSREVGSSFTQAPIPQMSPQELKAAYPGLLLPGEAQPVHLDSQGFPTTQAIIDPLRQMADGTAAAGEAQVFQLLDIDDLEVRHGQRPEFLVDGYLPRGATVLLAGVPGAGKSPLAQAWAVSVAMGVPWAGHEVERGRVLYVAAESPNQTAMNLVPFAQQAIAAAMGPGFGPDDVPADEARGMLRGRLLTMTHSFALERDTMGLIAAVQGRGRVDAGWAVGPDVVVLDTLRAIAGGSTNKDEDMAVVQHAIAHIRAAWPRACVVVLHHAPKGDAEGFSGSNRLEGMGDVLMTIAPVKKGGAADDDKAVVAKADRFGPCVDGWMYTQARVVMHRNKVWHVAPALGVLLQARENVLWMRWGVEAAAAAEKGNGGPFTPIGPAGKAGRPGGRGGGGGAEAVGGAEAGEAAPMGFAASAGGLGNPGDGGGGHGLGDRADAIAGAYRVIASALADGRSRTGPEAMEAVMAHPEASTAAEPVLIALGKAAQNDKAGRQMFMKRLREMLAAGLLSRTGSTKDARWAITPG